MILVLADRPLEPAPGRLLLSAEERHHLSVRRATPGQLVEVLDGRGRVASGVLEADQSVRIDQVETVPPLPSVVLLVGAGDKERFGWLVEKCVEIGVTEVVPVETERSLQVATRVRSGHIEKLGRRAQEGLKQCGGAWATDVRAPVTLPTALRAPAEQRWLADADGGPATMIPGRSLAVLIGPEGGFTEDERRAIVEAGFVPVRLGPRTMRFETAGVAAGIIARSLGENR